ncbi:MAG: hypothetical protein NUV80_02770 [Candidatus Berkelbacteria bacterium]|nr:hypothetical protein [Candidatus Berkelbacteria bacterium]MCR4307456.1 hypothetical protein [Candidatus Berkelbacteria bacterium]
MSIENEGGPILETDFPPGYSSSEEAEKLLKHQRELPETDNATHLTEHEASEPASPEEIARNNEFADTILKRFTSAPDDESRNTWGKALDLVTGKPRADHRDLE